MSNKTYPLQKTGSKVEELLHKIDVLSKDDIDLDQVDNTSDINKPVSNLQRQALNMILEEAKAYTNNEIAEFDFIKIVSVLPNEGLPNRIYLVPKTEIEEQNLFDEYLWVNNLWEWIATKSIDVDLTNIYTKNEINDLLEFKVDKVDGKGLSSNDFTNDYIANIANNTDNIKNLMSDLYQTPIKLIPTTLESNKQYNFGEVTELSLVFPTSATDGDVIYLTFKSSSTPTALTIDTTNTCGIEVIPEANAGYEIFGKFNGEIWIVNYSEYTVSEG